MDSLIEQLNGIVPAKYVTYATAAYVASQAAGRIYHAIVQGGGLRGIISALWFGTNTPKQ